MKPTLSIVALLGCCVCAAAQATRPATSAPSTRPSRADSYDLCRGAVDPYIPQSQRAKFFRAAGVDNELTAKEFEADRRRARGFIRTFDKWPALLVFDSNANRTIDWFEADAYRRDFRRRILLAFDTDRNGRLVGDERRRANAALASGKLDAGAGQGKRQQQHQHQHQHQHQKVSTETYRADLLRKYDTDKDGKLSDEERQAAFQQMQAESRQNMIDRYDTDADGKLSRQERRAMRREQRAPWNDAVRRWSLRDFDTNGDGELDEQEKAATAAFSRKFAEMGKSLRIDLRMSDIDGDGKVSPEERREVAEQWRQAKWKMIIRFSSYMDANGDGQVSPEEMLNFNQRLQPAFIDYFDDYAMRFDANYDGRLNEAERDTLVAGVGEDFDARMTAADSDGDGRITPDEAMDLFEVILKDIGLGKPSSRPAAAGEKKGPNKPKAPAAAK
ncbi:MAG: hypothetical protein J7M14_02900 [Planctomycetes bacterium]|nr:hypothetical protein [Planctomycetota bacterium]